MPMSKYIPLTPLFFLYLENNLFNKKVISGFLYLEIEINLLNCQPMNGSF